MISPIKHLFSSIMSSDDSGVTNILETLSHRQLQGSDQLINEKDKFGSTALHWAARTNNIHATSRILQLQNVDVNVRDKFGHTPVMVAAKSCHKEVMEILLDDNRVDLEIKENGGLPIEKVVGMEAGTTEQVIEIGKIIKDEKSRRKGDQDQDDSTDDEPFPTLLPTIIPKVEDEWINILKETTDEMKKIQEETRLTKFEQNEILLKKNKQISSVEEKEKKIEELAIASTDKIIKLNVEKESLKKRLEEIEDELEDVLESHSLLDQQLSKLKSKKSKLLSYFSHQENSVDGKLSIFDQNYRSLAKMLNKCINIKSTDCK